MGIRVSSPYSSKAGLAFGLIFEGFIMRLFVGLSFPNDIRQSLCVLTSGLDGARWVKLDSLHLTLRFIGDVSTRDAADLDAALSTIMEPAFNLRCLGLGHFGKGGKVRALWAGIAPNDGLSRLQDKVERAAVRAGFGDEGRKFKPHITIARFRGRKPRNLVDYLDVHGAFSTALFPVSSFTLFESHMGHGGSHYIPLTNYSLTA